MQFSDPFPHTIIDGFISPQTVRAINAEWPNDWFRECGKG